MEATPTEAKNVFTVRNYRLVFFGALVSELGALLYSFAVSFYILDISDNNAFLQGLYLALCGAFTLLATTVGGVLGDRYNKGRIMSVCDFLRGGIILLATLLMLLFKSSSAQLAALFAAGILGSVVGGIFNPSASGLLPLIVEESRLQQANSYFSVKSSLLSILGVVLAGILYGTVSVYLLFAAVGVCYLLSGVSEMFIRYKNEKPEERLTLGVMLSDMREGIRYVRGQKAIMALMAAILFINFFMSPVFNNFIPYFIKTDVAGASGYLFDNLLTPELWYSLLSVLIGVSSLAAALILSARKQADKCGHKTAIRLAMEPALLIIVTVGYWLLVDRGASLNAFLIMLSAVSVITGAIITGVNIPLNTALMRIVDKDKLSKVSSIITISAQGLVPIASVLAGLILQYLGTTTLLAFCTVGMSAAAIFLLFNKAVKEI